MPFFYTIFMNLLFLKIGAIFGALSVILGAFGAHALKETLLSSGRFETYETAIKYSFYHSLALILVGILSKEFTNKWLNYSGTCYIIGTIIFSGSLLILCFSGVKAMGAVAPIGGTLLVLAWIFLFLGIPKV